MSVKMRGNLPLLPGLAGVVLLLFTEWYAAGLILIGICLVLMFLLMRCPHCRRYLGRDYVAGRRCPYCGKTIE